MKRLLTIAAVVLWAGVACAQSTFEYNGLSYSSTGVTFANLGITPPQANGTLVYCSDCTNALPCAGGGNGAWAQRLNGSWNCLAGATGTIGANAIIQGQSGAQLNGLAGSGTTPSISGFNVTANNLTSNGAVSITGTQSNGADKINHVNGVHDGEANVLAYGAAGTQTGFTTGTINSGTNSLTVGSASTIKVGQSLFIPHAGAASTLAAETAPTNVAVVGSTGAVTKTYVCIALDAKHGHNTKGSGTTINNAPASITNTNFVRGKCPVIANAWGYAVYQTAGTNYLASISTSPWFIDQGGSVATLLPYLGNAFWDLSSTTPPAGAEADWLQTTVSAVNGTTVTLAASATTTATSVGITHDDTTAFANTLGAAKVTYAPSGSYFTCLHGGFNASATSLFGDPATGATLIINCPGEPFIQPNQNQTAVDIEHVTVEGGTWDYNLTFTGAMTNGSGTFKISDDIFLDYTSGGVSNVMCDCPFWKVDHNSFQTVNADNTIGVVMSAGTGEQVRANNFAGNRIHVKLYGGTGDTVADNTFLGFYALPNPQQFRVNGVWIVPGATSQVGAGFASIHNKYGNEGASPTMVGNLLADDDTTSGTALYNYMPLAIAIDDAAMNTGTATLTSASECPFTLTMVGWNCVDQTAGSGNVYPSFTNTDLTTTISAFTNSCGVTLGNNATASVTNSVLHCAPNNTTEFANNLQFHDNGIFFAQPFIESAAQHVTEGSIRNNLIGSNVAIELLTAPVSPSEGWDCVNTGILSAQEPANQFNVCGAWGLTGTGNLNNGEYHTFVQVQSAGPNPTLGACGTGAGVGAGSAELGGQITSGTGTTSCVVNFPIAFPNHLFCTASDATRAAGLEVTTGSTSSFTVSGLTASDVFTYNCNGN